MPKATSIVTNFTDGGYDIHVVAHPGTTLSGGVMPLAKQRMWTVTVTDHFGRKYVGEAPRHGVWILIGQLAEEALHHSIAKMNQAGV